MSITEIMVISSVTTL